MVEYLIASCQGILDSFIGKGLFNLGVELHNFNVPPLGGRLVCIPRLIYENTCVHMEPVLLIRSCADDFEISATEAGAGL